ncbi:MAG TPA: zinc ribbon domain-containing protein [Terriglobia bacterium]|nr:zinc ribbon domain-containing protein [Terriglobia bacterium]
MPIFEYRCRGCGKEFEVLVLPGSPKTACPRCGSGRFEQLLSAFAASSEERSRAALKAARKRYTETVLRDKKIAAEEEKHHHH